MSNHLVIEVKAQKITTHEPEDYDVTYMAYLRGEVEVWMQQHGFNKYTVDLRIEKDD